MVLVVWWLSVMLWWWRICVIRATPWNPGGVIDAKLQPDIAVPQEAHDPEYWAL